MKLVSLAHGYIDKNIKLIDSEIEFRSYELKTAIEDFELQNQHERYRYEEMIDIAIASLIVALEHKKPVLRGNKNLSHFIRCNIRGD